MQRCICFNIALLLHYVRRFVGIPKEYRYPLVKTSILFKDCEGRVTSRLSMVPERFTPCAKRATLMKQDGLAGWADEIAVKSPFLCLPLPPGRPRKSPARKSGSSNCVVICAQPRSRLAYYVASILLFKYVTSNASVCHSLLPLLLYFSYLFPVWALSLSYAALEPCSLRPVPYLLLGPIILNYVFIECNSNEPTTRSAFRDI